MPTVARAIRWCLVAAIAAVQFVLTGLTAAQPAPTEDPSAGLTAVAAGNTYSLALKTDGSVWAWGDTSFGQFGNRTNASSAAVQRIGLSGVSAIAARYEHSLALGSDGTAWAWGSNSSGQLGDGSATDRSSPVRVSGRSGVSAIAAGYEHSLALGSDGTAWAWGRNSSGQLGDGSATNRSSPVQVGLSGVSAIAAGHTFSLALGSDGTVWAWGNNWAGQLGDGSTTNRYRPVRVSGLSGVSAIAAGVNHSLALGSDGTVWAWGASDSGRSGGGSATTHYTPVQVSGLSGVSSIAAGWGYSLALGSDGTVWAWGANESGQLGDGSTTNRYTPVQVSGLPGVSAIAAGWGYGLALGSDGTPWAWGENYAGQLGAAANIWDGGRIYQPTAVQVSEFTAGNAANELRRRTEATRELNQSLQEFFERYYAARTRGDREAVTAMTGDRYQAVALDTLPADTGVSFTYMSVQWWYIPPPSGPTGADPNQPGSLVLSPFQLLPKDTLAYGGWELALSVAPEPTPTNVANRDGVPQGTAFKVRRGAESWQIVDMRDPGLGRWLSDPVPATAALPQELDASLRALLQNFYEVRGFRRPEDNRLQERRISALTGNMYTAYVEKMRAGSQMQTQSEHYEIKGVQVLRWMPNSDGTGTAEVLVTRTLTEVDDSGNAAASTGDARLLVRWAPDELGSPASWRVVDGYLQQEGAWVSGIPWSTLYTHA